MVRYVLTCPCPTERERETDIQLHRHSTEHSLYTSGFYFTKTCATFFQTYHRRPHGQPLFCRPFSSTHHGKMARREKKRKRETKADQQRRRPSSTSNPSSSSSCSSSARRRTCTPCSRASWTGTKTGKSTPSISRPNKRLTRESRRATSVMGIFWKCARIGERLSPYVSIFCVAMAVSCIPRPQGNHLNLVMMVVPSTRLTWG